MSEQYLYAAFGMCISSALPLDLPPSDAVNVQDTNIKIVLGKIPKSTLLPFTLDRVGNMKYGRFGPTLLFDIPNIARYSLGDGFTISVDPYPDADQKLVALYITGLFLVLLLKRRGIIALHGSAVVGSSGALAFIGSRGSGKSTTAAALTAHGYKMLCDDIVPVADGPLLLPGIPRPKLLPDAYEMLIGDPRKAMHLLDGVDKYQVELPFSQNAAPLRAVFLLEKTEEAELSILPLKGAGKLHSIVMHVITLEGIDDAVSHFSTCSERLSDVSVYRVRRPVSRQCLDELVQRISATIISF